MVITRHGFPVLELSPVMHAARRSARRDVLSVFDAGRNRFAEQEETRDADILAASGMIRRLHLNQRAPTAINLAITRRIGVTLATFDAAMAAMPPHLGSQC